MPVFTHKIGTATSQRDRDRKSSAESKSSQSNGGIFANKIAPFPALTIEPFPAPKIEPFPAPKPEIEPFPPPRTPTHSISISVPKSSPPGKKGVPNVPPADYKNMVLSAARVKSVLSGDSLILCSQTNPDAEKTLSLAYCTSPHLKKDGDEQWAFESRDALRKLVVGVNIQFTVLYTIPNTKREYGLVYLNDGRRLPEEMLKQGWLKLREDAGRKEESLEAQQHIEQLRILEAQAKADDLGLWQPSGGRIDVQHDMGDSKAFLDEWKGKEVRGLVERVLSGDRMLVRILASPTKHYQRKHIHLTMNVSITNLVSVMTLVAGIRAPTTERVNPSNGQVQPAEEFGNDARKFVESRLLQREVLLEILGLSPQGQVIATIKHPRHGTIAKHILEAGLARCSDFHSTMLGAGMAELRAAEKLAQDGKKGVHKDHVAKSTAQGSNLEAQVTKVFSADVIFVQNRSGVEKRINLSSIRGPRQNEAAESPFRDEAKEFLRKKVIGKKVRLSIDGTRPANGQYDAKEVATITLNDKNINLLLVQEGWCSVVRHKRDDSDRAPNYDDLLAAEEAAKKDSKGMWSGKPAKAKQYVDASESLQKARLQLGGLQRQKKIPAIVDFVKGGSRFVVLIPRESIKITFVLSGIRAPKSARNATDKSEPGGQEAHELAVKRLTQRDVEIDVRDTDKMGGFIGDLYINKESFAKILVEEGFASVWQGQADGNELFAAEQRAKDGKKGIWANWDPSHDGDSATDTPTNGTNGEAAGPRPQDYRQVVVTHMDETGKLKIQQVGTTTSALETMMVQFKKFHLNPSNNKGFDGMPKTGEYVAAKFTEDGQWYRARVRANDRTAKESEVVYIDYGNSEKIPWSRLRPLSQPEFSTSKLRGQATDAILSLIQFPTNKDYLEDAIRFVQEITANKELVANVDYTGPDGTLYVTLGEASAKETINSEIIAEGHAMVPRKLQKWELSMSDILKGLAEKQEEAIQDRRGLWEYGDLRDD
jgi:staphylococcal nuclease domain-containing protein 1